MSSATSIEWADFSWNPTTGCTHVHEGCRNCCAERISHRMAKNPNNKVRAVYAGITNEKGKFNGRINLHHDRLLDPLKWKRPRKVFVDSMSDLFHEAVPDEFIHRVLATISLCPQHTFIVLTKRPARMRKLMNRPTLSYVVAQYAAPHMPRDAVLWNDDGAMSNLWLGASASDQATYDAAIGDVLATPAAVRLMSLEPMLGPIDIGYGVDDDGHCIRCGLDVWGFDESYADHECPAGFRRPNLIIVGGESGPLARPNDLKWTRRLIAQCAEANIPLFHKQAGSRPVLSGNNGDAGDVIEIYPGGPTLTRSALTVDFQDSHGGDPSEWPEDLRVRQWPI